VPDIPAPLAAALLPRYRLERELGAGGMATVYLAHDVKHERQVAIKVVNRDLALVLGVHRFVAEIRTTAHLRHPHILPLFDSGVADGLPFYVMPFVDGESLRARLQRDGRLPIAEAVRILRELADALAHAHARGIIHRDVKPDNVLVSNRHVSLADFGVAHAVAAHVGEDQTVTGTGVLVGTPAYMSPEQVAAAPLDGRSDIYAFGVMAYELLTGTPPFRGPRQDVVTAHLTQSPVPLAALRPETPPPLADAIMRCLQKKPDQRWQRIDDLVSVLDALPATDAATPDASRVTRRRTWLLAVVATSAALAIGYYALNSRLTRGALTVGQILRVTTEPGLELDPTISPDGRAVAFVGGTPGHLRIYVRQIAGGRMVPLTEDDGSGGQRWPQWSADGTQILFQSGRPRLARRSVEGRSALFVVPALGGAPRRLTGPTPEGVALTPAWSPDNRRIAFAGADGVYLMDVANGVPPARIAPAEEAHSLAWSPDGRRIAFVSRGIFFTLGEESLGNVSTSTIFVVDLENRTSAAVTSGDWLDVSPIWMPDSRAILFVSSRGGGRDVFRQRFTRSGLQDGEPERVSSGLNAHGISVSRDGRLLVYSSYTQRANIWSVAIPEEGVASVRQAEQVTFGSEKIEKLTVSRDGQWLAYDSDRNGQADVWKMKLGGRTTEQVTRGPNNEFVNDWSPDGEEIVYHSMTQGGQRDVMVVSADGMRTEVVAGTSAEEQHAAWGPDGNSILFDQSTGSAPNDLMVSRRARRGAPWQPARRLATASSDPKWSRDGHLIAYCSGGELLVIAPDGSGHRVIVSAASGLPRPSYPIWSDDSRTIYYKAYDANLQTSIWAVRLDGSPPRLLVTFDDPARRSLRREFATDGRRFYFTIASDESDLWAMQLIER
jgi:eukaryotic-like serine/threonine-protein kinase